MTKLDTRRAGTGKTGGPTVRAAIDAFLDSPTIKGNPNTLRAYTGVLDRAAEVLGPDRALADVVDDEIAEALTALWGEAKPSTWNRNRAAVGSWLTWCASKQHWAAPTMPAAVERRRENNDDTKAVSRSRIDRLCRRRDVPLREKTLWRMLYESASRASAVLALNIEDLDLPNKQARVTVKGGDTMWITWGTDTAHLLPRLIAGRERGPLFLSEYRPGPHRRATTDPRDLCPETGRARLGYDRARILLGHYGDGLRLHQLRHSSATHLGDANTSANVIMAKTGHKSLRSVQRYVKPGLAAVHQATETLSSPRRRG
ncbi:tyrosine-type recombinase/integrase [Amycolatopsis thermoflava]|uniref:tyrosine-type recombinase/integrase n=1 Tax=Amycolatopsis thermoflava TaxID=84480 RepID=UPI003659F6AC